jgi:hypothetical protein
MLQTIGLRMRSHRSVRDYPFVKTICGGRTERVANERIAFDIRQQTSAQTSSRLRMSMRSAEMIRIPVESRAGSTRAQ